MLSSYFDSSCSTWYRPVIWLLIAGNVISPVIMSGEPQLKRSKMSVLEQLKQYSTVVADTGDFEGKTLALVSQIIYYFFLFS